MYSVPYFQLSIIPYSSFQYLMKMYAGVELGKGVQLLSIPYFFKYALSVPAGGGGRGGPPSRLICVPNPGTILAPFWEFAPNIPYRQFCPVKITFPT